MSSTPAPGSLLPPIVPPSSLYSEEARRDATRVRTYNNVLQAIYTKIKAVARIPGNEKCLWYVVPEFIPGTARFNVEDCVLYVVWNLRNVGYSVVYTHPNFLYISWKNHDDKYKERESPWAQVLEAAREQVIVSAKQTTIPSVVPRASSARPTTATAAPMRLVSRSSSTLIPDTITAAESEIKRKSVLKKTSEYRPVSAQMLEQTTTHSQSQSGSGGGLTGTLTPRHVSFV